MNKTKIENKKIIYIFKNGRKRRLLNKNLNYPTEFFYCAKEFIKDNLNIEIYEEIDLGFRFKKKLPKKFFNLFSKIFFNLPIVSVIGFIISSKNKLVKKKDILIATTNSIGMTLSICKKLGFINSEVFFINMGLISLKPNFLKVIIYKFFLNKINLICLSKSELIFLSTILKLPKLRYLPFGVDNKFWNLKNDNFFKKPFVLAVGNDLARDWDILIDSWEYSFLDLKIITSLPVKNTKKNIEIIHGNWNSENISDLEMRNFFSNSEFVIIPLKETIQPSGQSSCLQAMACSKAVIISEIKGIWDQKLLKHKKNIYFVKTGDKLDLKNAIKLLSKNLELRKKIGENGRKLVNKYFNTTKMAAELKNILREN